MEGCGGVRVRRRVGSQSFWGERLPLVIVASASTSRQFIGKSYEGELWLRDGGGEVGSGKGEGYWRGSRVEVSWSWFGHVGVSAPGPLFPCAGAAFLGLFAP